VTTGGEGDAKRTLQLMVEKNFSLRLTNEPSGGGRQVALGSCMRKREGGGGGEARSGLGLLHLQHIRQIALILVDISVPTQDVTKTHRGRERRDILPVGAVGAH
jgi:hypothetical protein